MMNFNGIRPDCLLPNIRHLPECKPIRKSRRELCMTDICRCASVHHQACSPSASRDSLKKSHPMCFFRTRGDAAGNPYEHQCYHPCVPTKWRSVAKNKHVNSSNISFADGMPAPMCSGRPWLIGRRRRIALRCGMCRIISVKRKTADPDVSVLPLFSDVQRDPDQSENL